MPISESKVQTRSSTNRELYDTISALFSSDKLDLNALLSKQDNDRTELEKQPKETANYLHALLGLNQDVESSSTSVLKTKVTASSRPRSVSFSTPEVKDGYSRGSSGLNSESSNSPVSPVRMRSHSSEAGSPTLEQALLMGRDSPGSDAGYGSFQSGPADLNSFVELRRVDDEGSLSPNSRTCDRSFSPGEPRPTLATLVEADLAVAQAAQNLQDMKERQAAIYQGIGVANAGLKESSNILSALLSATQVSRAPDYQSVERDEQKRGKSSLIDSLFDRDPREGVDRNFLDRDSFDRTKDPLALERAARQYRNAASIHEANCTWSGQLPPKQSPGRQPSYSSKIFLGGVPWDITEAALIQAFMDFGSVRVEWPGREAASPPRGYVYIVFEDEDRVKELLSHCSHDFSNGGSYYFKISSKKRGSKEIQIIPWLVADSNYVSYPSPRLDPKKTVFVGALHGMINAQSLAVIFNDLFGGVVYAGLDTDKHKYPIGSGRVTFANSKSYMKAVAAAFIEIKTPRFCKKVQVDPYLEDALCSMCHMRGPYFCRDLNCFNYYCRNCWDQQHANQIQHKPLMRNIRGLTRARLQDILPSASGDCYSPLYQSSRENKLFMDLWGEQDKRSEDSWRAQGFEKPDSWRSETWRSPPEITWRNQERSSDFGWSNAVSSQYDGDEYNRLTNVFSESFSISDRKTGFKSVLDRDSSTFRPAKDSTSYRFLDKDVGVLHDPMTMLQEDHGHRRNLSQEMYRSQKMSREADEDGFRQLLEREQEGRRQIHDRDFSLHAIINRDQVLRPLLERNADEADGSLELK